MQMLLISLLVFAADAPSELTLPPPAEFGRAPEMPRVPADLEEPEVFMDRVCFPARTARVFGEWMSYADLYPSKICQPAIDQTVVGCRMWAESKQAEILATNQENLAKMRAHQATYMSPWIAWGIVAGVFLVGGLGGYLVGQCVAN